MSCQWIKQCRMVSVMLSLLLACLISTSVFAGHHAPLSQNSLTQSIDAQLHPATGKSVNPALYFQVEQRAPAKSLAPNLASILRNGSFAPERLHEAEPTYELVFEFANTCVSVLIWHSFLTLNAWQDWTLHPPSTKHRIAGWKESNLLYRYLSQSDA